MRTKTKRNLFDLAFDFNLFCVGVAVCIVGLHWCAQIDPNFTALSKLFEDVKMGFDLLTGQRH